jgi:hypothetical protein
MQLRRSRCHYFITCLIVALSLSATLNVAQSDKISWVAWETLDISTISDDHSGSSVVKSSNVKTPDDNPTLMITPNGISEETKIAVPFTGEDLADWAYYTQLELQVYLPTDNADNPNKFFMGMADVTDSGFTWIAGVFSDTMAQTGWSKIAYPIHPAMGNLTADHNYNLYFSFYLDNGNKIPLTEPFYLGTVHLGAPSADANADDTYGQEVTLLLGMDDRAFVDTVARETFDYFWLETDLNTGLIKDRSTPDSPASIAAVGFGLAAIPFGVDQGWITYDEGYQRVLTTLQRFANDGVEGEHGFFYHFVNRKTGERVWSSELSSIDTTLLIAGALVAGQYFQGTEVQTLANQLYSNVEWDWMLGGGKMPKMGWLPDSGFLNYAWDHFDESLLLYVLAIGSPTHPISAETWDRWRRPVNTSGGYIYLPGEPLFVYQYPQAFLDLQGMEDYYANYWNNTVLACERNHQFAVHNAGKYTTFQNGVWGLSASDGPLGYRAYGAASNNTDGTVAPYAAVSCLPFTPDLSLAGMRAILTEYGTLTWREYGFVSAINEDQNWYSRDHIGIDQGDILLMIANYETSFTWNLFMANPSVQNGLAAMGFVESSGDYAVTPAYMAEFKGS